MGVEVSNPQYAVSSSPPEPSPWATTQPEHDHDLSAEWTNRPILSTEASPILAMTDVSFAVIESLSPETNYAQSVEVPGWQFPLDDEERSLVVGEILEYPRLQPGWDGSPDDIAPSSAAADQAATFVELLPAFVPVPQPSVAADGEIILFWEDDGLYIEVGFRGGEYLSYFAECLAEKVKGSTHVDQMFSSSDNLATFLIEAFTHGTVHV
jgi:hypothetical protein